MGARISGGTDTSHGPKTKSFYDCSLDLSITFLQSSWHGNQKPHIHSENLLPPTSTQTPTMYHAMQVTGSPMSIVQRVVHCLSGSAKPALAWPNHRASLLLVGWTTPSPVRSKSFQSLSFLGYSTSAYGYPIVSFYITLQL